LSVVYSIASFAIVLIIYTWKQQHLIISESITCRRIGSLELLFNEKPKVAFQIVKELLAGTHQRKLVPIGALAG